MIEGALAHVLFSALIYVLGAHFLFFYCREEDPILLPLLSFFFGSTILVVGVIILLVVGIPYTPWAFWVLVAALVAVPIAQHFRRWRLLLRQRSALAGLAAVCTISSIFGFTDYSLFTHDSYAMVESGLAINTAQHIALGSLYPLLIHGPFLQFLYSMSPFFGIDFFYGFIPIQFAIFAVTFCILVNRHLQTSNFNRMISLVLALALTTLLISTPIVMLHGHYIEPNLGYGIYFFIVLYCLWYPCASGKEFNMPMFILATFTCIMYRNESVIYISFFSPFLLAENLIPHHKRIRSLIYIFIAMLAWYALLYSFAYTINANLPSFDRILAILNKKHIILLVSPSIAFMLIIAFINKHPSFPIKQNHLYIYASAAIVITAFISFNLATKKITTSLQALYNNYFFGGWGVTFTAILTLFAISLLFKVYRPNKYTFYFLCYFAILIILNYFREPYKYKIHDSASRMTLHIMPALFYHLVATRFPGSRAKEPAGMHREP